MIKVDQRYPPDPDPTQGDCLSACIASILEIPVEQVPVFRGPRWTRLVNEFLRPHGFAMIGYMADHEAAEAPPFYHIVSGPAPEEPDAKGGHAVVCHEDWMVHDPNNTRSGITKIVFRWVLVPLDRRLVMPPPAIDQDEEPTITIELPELRDYWNLLLIMVIIGAISIMFAVGLC